MDHLIVRGAREHNLKNVNLEVPRNALIVFTGLSGSGKSSLAFDTIMTFEGRFADHILPLPAGVQHRFATAAFW